MSKKAIFDKIIRGDASTNLVLEFGPEAIMQFKKYHPLKVSISYTNPYQTTALLKTYVNVNHSEELAEMVNWLLFLGSDLKIKEAPEEIIQRMQERLSLLCP